jgi:hypothetical protein
MHTFVVRVWTPAEAGEPFDLHGIVEHVGSGEPRRFRGPEELLAALRAELGTPVRPSTPATDRPPAA